MAAHKSKIMVVDGDEASNRAVTEKLEEAGYAVVCLPTGASAISHFGMENIDAVLVEVTLSDGNGIQLLHRMKKIRSVPSIVMSSHLEIRSKQDADAVGVIGYLIKPFTSQDLVKLLGPHCPPGSDDQPGEGLYGSSVDSWQEALTEGYYKLDIQSFNSSTQLLFDVSVRLPSGRYLKVAKKGDYLTSDRLKSYASKGIKYLFMEGSDFDSYVGINVSASSRMKEIKEIPRETKLKFLASTSSIVMTKIRLEGVNEETFHQSRVVLETTLAMIANSTDLTYILYSLNEFSNPIFAHSLAVSLHSAMIAKELGWKSSQTLIKLAMGGLLHDIGKKKLPEEILRKPEHELTPRELELVRSHTSLGVEFASKFPAIPDDVIHIISQHHETCLGTGYPRGLQGIDIFPLAKVVAVANEFCNLAIRDVDTSPNKRMTPMEVLKSMGMAMSGAMDPNSFQALARLFKVKINTAP